MPDTRPDPLATPAGHTVQIVSGPEGPSLYLDEYRIAGPKPWGGGTILHEFDFTDRDLIAAGVTLTQPQPDARLREALHAAQIAMVADPETRWFTNDLGESERFVPAHVAIREVNKARAALRSTPAAPDPVADVLLVRERDQPQPDAGLREALNALFAAIQNSDATHDRESLRAAFYEVDRLVLRSTPAAPQPDTRPTGDTARQHEYRPGGRFEFRQGETFPPHIVYIDRDAEGRRCTTFVCEVYANALDFAAALASPAPETAAPGLREAAQAVVTAWDNEVRAVMSTDVDTDLDDVALATAAAITELEEALATESPTEQPAPPDGSAVAPLDVERLREAIYSVSVRHDWANSLDTEDRTEEIAREYAALRSTPAAPKWHCDTCKALTHLPESTCRECQGKEGHHFLGCAALPWDSTPAAPKEDNRE